MVDFSRMKGPLCAAFFADSVKIAQPAFTVSAHGDRLPAAPVSLGELRCDVQSYSAALAQKDYGLAQEVQKRLYCAADERVLLGRLVKVKNEWYRIAALPETGAVYAALLERTEEFDPWQ